MGWPERLPSGKYAARYRDAAGNRRTAGSFTHKAAATRAANEAEAKARRRATVGAGHKWAWGDWRTEWLATRAVEASTARTDASRIKNHLTPRWEDVRLTAITRNDVKKWAKTMRKDGVSASTVQRIVHLFSASLNAAVDDELLDVNPAHRLKLEQGSQAQERYLDVEEYEALLAQLSTYRDQLIVKILTNTGLRWGELAGLHWNRVDLVRGHVRVIETWSEAGREIKAYPKGRRVRDVPLPDWLVAELRELPVSIGGCGHPHASGSCRSGLVLTTDRGNVLHHSKWSHAFRQAVEDAHLDHVRIHDLRHTYASWLLQSGEVSLDEVGKLLGHVDPKTTQKYAHLARKASAGVLRALPAPRLPHEDTTERLRSQVRTSGKVKGQRSHTPNDAPNSPE